MYKYKARNIAKCRQQMSNQFQIKISVEYRYVILILSSKRYIMGFLICNFANDLQFQIFFHLS